ncbi:matrix Gla protein-like [Simochromis diagramma]|uniref:matrix Gla protein-like n=1 Tax=Simochromis diagramma TaxID=43689 RepID=UPI001A7E69EB|nr:matrix Gla protein-like [Simochromis diagramma]
MRSLLRLLALCAAVSLCVCYESHESTESTEDLFVPPNRANSFIPPQRGNIYIPSRGNGFGSYNHQEDIQVSSRKTRRDLRGLLPLPLLCLSPRRPAGLQQILWR